MLDYNKGLLKGIFITIMSLVVVVFFIGFEYSIKNIGGDDWIIIKK